MEPESLANHQILTPNDPIERDPEPGDVKQVIVIRRDLHMRRGKEIAQGSHASCAWLAELVTQAMATTQTDSPTIRLTDIPVAARVWLTSTVRKVTLQVQTEAELMELHDHATAAGLLSHLILDSGKTEFGGVPTVTALAIGPGIATDIDAITGALSIY